jgi:hypothetical protein
MHKFYFSLLTTAAAIIAALFFLVSPVLRWAIFSMGVGVGMALLLWDQAVAHRWYHATPRELITRSPLFLFVFLPLYVYITSTSNVSFGVGVVIGMALFYMSEFIWYEQLQPVRQLYSVWDERFSSQEWRWIRWGMSIAFVLAAGVYLW